MESKHLLTETLFVRLPAKRVFPSLLGYLKAQPDLTVKRYVEPSLIWLKIKSSLRKPQTLRNVAGDLMIKIFPGEELSTMEFNFDFSERWRLDFIVGAFLWVFPIFPFAFLVFLGIPVHNFYKSLGIMIGFWVLYLVARYFQANATKKRFLTKLKDFLKSS